MRIWIALLGQLFLWTACFQAKAQFTGAWSDQFGNGNGLNGAVYAIVTDSSGNVYVGGDFTVAGTMDALRIAKWADGTWEALGNGFNDVVFALALGPDGHLYAGGEFTASGALSVDRVARWDGQTWQPLAERIGNEGTSGRETVYTLAVDASGSLYMGGDFRSIDGREAKGIAMWDGNQWNEVGSGFDGAGCGDLLLDDVYEIAVSEQNEVYAVGNMQNSNGLPINGAAKWNGQMWEGLEANISVGACRSLFAVSIYDNEVFAGGGFSEIGGIPAQSIAKWTGDEWQALGEGMAAPLSGGVLVLEPDTRGLYAGGEALSADDGSTVGLLKWNGATWESIGGRLNESAKIFAIAPYESKVYIGGEFLREAGGVLSFGIAMWEETTASSVSENPTSLSDLILSIYPNPFQNTVTIRFSISTPERLVVQIYDALGRHVAQLTDTVFAPGIHTLSFDGGALPSGAYTLQLHTRGQVVSRTVIKIA